MIAYIVFFAVVLLITLLGTYMVIENNRRKAIELKKKMFNDRVKSINNNYKTQLNHYVDARILRPKFVPKMTSIVANFFVVQPHEEENLDTLDFIAAQLMNTLNAELTKAETLGTKDELEDKMQYFIAALPSQGIDYNKGFYSDVLPDMIKSLQTPPLANLASAEENEEAEEEEVALEALKN